MMTFSSAACWPVRPRCWHPEGAAGDHLLRRIPCSASKAFSAAVLGGIGNLRGALLGGLISASWRTTRAGFRGPMATSWPLSCWVLVLLDPSHRDPR